ncbi:hypothetical protein LZ30DRAFT_11378 [Colletotrichum cereale]|nr:hypothetical protein LZ30DRAFT_11378 [Colletotrichum cereale]
MPSKFAHRCHRCRRWLPSPHQTEARRIPAVAVGAATFVRVPWSNKRRIAHGSPEGRPVQNGGDGGHGMVVGEASVPEDIAASAIAQDAKPHRHTHHTSDSDTHTRTHTLAPFILSTGLPVNALGNAFAEKGHRHASCNAQAVFNAPSHFRLFIFFFLFSPIRPVRMLTRSRP